VRLRGYVLGLGFRVQPFFLLISNLTLVQEPDRWSPAMNSFLRMACEVDPLNRASADDLLQHEFVRSAATRPQFAQLLLQCKKA
jgi:hypothetical protein